MLYYNNCKFDIETITHSVPQGFILGPLLIIIYMNDFSKSSGLLFAILYADDTYSYLKEKIYKNIILELNKELQKLNHD